MVLTLVCVDCKQFESPVVVNAVLLSEYEYQAPQVAYQPRVDTVIAFVCGHENFRHIRNASLETESLQMLKKL